MANRGVIQGSVSDPENRTRDSDSTRAASGTRRGAMLAVAPYPTRQDCQCMRIHSVIPPAGTRSPAHPCQYCLPLSHAREHACVHRASLSACACVLTHPLRTQVHAQPLCAHSPLHTHPAPSHPTTPPTSSACTGLSPLAPPFPSPSCPHHHVCVITCTHAERCVCVRVHIHLVYPAAHPQHLRASTCIRVLARSV